MSYYNTSHVLGEQLIMFNKKAQTQDGKILSYFKEQPAVEYTPSQIWRLLFNKQTPLTSVRRSITTLTTGGYLVKTSNQRTGEYGRPENTWRFRTPKTLI